MKPQASGSRLGALKGPQAFLAGALAPPAAAVCPQGFDVRVWPIGLMVWSIVFLFSMLLAFLPMHLLAFSVGVS